MSRYSISICLLKSVVITSTEASESLMLSLVLFQIKVVLHVKLKPVISAFIFLCEIHLKWINLFFTTSRRIISSDSAEVLIPSWDQRVWSDLCSTFRWPEDSPVFICVLTTKPRVKSSTSDERSPLLLIMLVHNYFILFHRHHLKKHNNIILFMLLQSSSDFHSDTFTQNTHNVIKKKKKLLFTTITDKKRW